MAVNWEAVKNVLQLFTIVQAVIAVATVAAAVFAGSMYGQIEKMRKSMDEWSIKWDERTRAK